ncbi:MAG: Holliday junction resolvase RuvX [bacterium]|nr:Holliday junction resolvase RuvX [bacterium]
MSILGLDVGEKRIGVAISAGDGNIAVPLKVLHRMSKEKDIREIKNIIAENKVTEIVVGLPRRLDGTLQIQADKVQRFIQLLQEHIDIPIHTWNEWLTSKEAERTLITADVSRQKRKQVIDKLAAVLILQGYLDAHETKK